MYVLITLFDKAFVAKAFSDALFTRATLAHMLTTNCRDPENLLAWSSFKLTSRMRPSSEPSQEQNIQNGYLVYTFHVLFSYHKLVLF